LLCRHRLACRIGCVGNGGPAPTDPVSPLVGSACCSLTFKFSRKGSLFGNFHSLRNRYRRGLTKILGNDRPVFRANPVMLPRGIGPERPDASYPPRGFRINMATATSQKAGDVMAIEKCINEFGVDEVIFEEGSTGRELFVVLDGKVESPRSAAPARPSS
jgi:hypothetical protein